MSRLLPLLQLASSVTNVKATIAMQIILFMFFLLV
jgi:hypothetical protein